jgi:biotin carboxyl carrier protein
MSSPKYVLSIAGSTFHCRMVSDRLVEVDGRQIEFDFRHVGGDLFSLILNGSSYVVSHLPDSTVRSADRNAGLSKTVQISINNVEFDVSVDDEKSLLVKQFGDHGHGGPAQIILRAPMPGLITMIEIEVGNHVSKGQGLLVLEAMKMENEIRSAENGKVKEIHVHKAKPVEKGEPLVTIELL